MGATELRGWLLLTVLAALYVSSVAKADAQTPATTATGSSPPAAQVSGEAARTDLQHRVDAFVRAVTRSSGSADEDSLVRWNAPICLLVAGLGAEDVKVVSARLSQIGSFAGAPLARSPCQANFIVVATSEPDRVLDAWYARDSHLFGDAPPAHIRQFLEGSQSRPVLVWYNVDSGRKAGMRNGHFVPSDTQGDSSSFNAHAVLGFSSIVAIIDTQRTAHATLDQLAAYVAMTGLTQVDLDADLGSAPSILRLFAPSAESHPSGLSTWDTAFLRALYRSNPTSRTQRFEIAERVAHDLSR
ncbi:MAG: hypothetical protein WBF89_08285 [Steroidobacteraceae bacterium]|jgi:hypothetical protein